jgi:hypothetical protein
MFCTDDADTTEHFLFCAELLWNCRVAVLDERLHWNCWRKIAIHKGDKVRATAAFVLNYSAVSAKEKIRLQSKLGLSFFSL